MNKEERVAQAVAYFKEGYNCAQSVVLAYADLYGLTHDLALHVAASFGGGIGRMRETCGAACGMFLLAGFERCATSGADREARARHHKVWRVVGTYQERPYRFHSRSPYPSVLCQASLFYDGRKCGAYLRRLFGEGRKALLSFN